MRIYINWFFLGLLFLAACKGSAVPEDVIPQKKMTGLLTEVHIADGTMYATVQNPDSLYQHGMAKYLDIFKRYGTDTIQFKRSMQYYTAHPDVLELMYNDIFTTINAKTDSLSKLRDQVQKAQTDSIQRLKNKTPGIDSLNKNKI